MQKPQATPNLPRSPRSGGVAVRSAGHIVSRLNVSSTARCCLRKAGQSEC